MKSTLHDRIIDYLYNNPELLGMEDAIYRAKEPSIYSGGKLLTEPDLMFMLPGEPFEYHWFEGKSTNAKRLWYKGVDQCNRISQYVEEHGMTPSYIYLFMPRKKGLRTVKEVVNNLALYKL